MPIVVTAPYFADGGAIPPRFTADGSNVSPALAWSGVPAPSRELAVVVDDPDAPGATWVHWVIYKIPAGATGLPEGIPWGATPPEPAGAFQGKNSWGKLGYGGPAPPKGHGVHHYRFKLFALDAPLDVFHSLTAEQLGQALRGHIIEQGKLVGTYAR